MSLRVLLKISTLFQVEASTTKMEKWKNSVAIVTGANSGNGFATFLELAKNGIKVVALDLKIDAIVELKALMKDAEIYGLVCDITDDDSTVEAFKWVCSTLGGVDILINNAGIIREIGIFQHDKPMEELQKTIDLNFTASVRCARLAFKSMLERKTYGYIVNINSVYGHGVSPFAADETIHIGVYPGTKYAITATTEVMRMELNLMKNYKVRVSSVSPGVVQTGLFKAAQMSEKTENILYRKPVLKPENIADAICYLLSTPFEVTINELTIRATGAEL